MLSWHLWVAIFCCLLLAQSCGLKSTFSCYRSWCICFRRPASCYWGAWSACWDVFQSRKRLGWLHRPSVVCLLRTWSFLARFVLTGVRTQLPVSVMSGCMVASAIFQQSQWKNGNSDYCRCKTLTVQGVPKKWSNLFLSELRQISTKFDNFWYTDSQDDKNM